MIGLVLGHSINNVIPTSVFYEEESAGTVYLIINQPFVLHCVIPMPASWAEESAGSG